MRALHPMRRARWIAACAFAVAGAAASAEGGDVELPRSSVQPDELGIVVRAGDPLSEQVGELYRAARGIPRENVVRVAFAENGDSMPAAEFAALKAEVDRRLPGRVQATLLTWTRPWRVTGGCAMSITSAFAFGHDDRRCRLGDAMGGLPSPYFDSDSTRPWDDLGLRPSMMLGATTVTEARALIERGRRAEGSRPAGTGYLVRTSDVVRSIRVPDFDEAVAAQRRTGLGPRLVRVDPPAGMAGPVALAGRTDVLFYFTGSARTPGLDRNTYRPGAVGDSLTSFGGVLDGSAGQTPVTDWLRAGLTGSYGTVEEPFAHVAKFPQASVLIDHYARGATLIEAYWKSVRLPGQGLFVGDPLARPFADVPRVQRTAGGVALVTRALRHGARYPVLRQAGSAWEPVGFVVGQGARDAPHVLPRIPAGTRLQVGALPCLDRPAYAAAVRGDAGPVATGVAHRFAFQVVVARRAEPAGCEAAAADDALHDLSVATPPDSVSVSGARGLTLPAGHTAVTTVDAVVSAAAAPPVTLPIALTHRRSGRLETLGTVRVELQPPEAVSRPLRFVEPGAGWRFDAGQRQTMHVAVEVADPSTAHRVHVSLHAALGAHRPVAEALLAGPAYTAGLSLPALPAGVYRLVARTEDASGAVRDAVSVLLNVVPASRRVDTPAP